MLRRTEGATIAQIAKALDWQLHSVRGAISGSLKKKQGLTVVAEKAADGERVYRIAGLSIRHAILSRTNARGRDRPSG